MREAEGTFYIETGKTLFLFKIYKKQVEILQIKYRTESAFLYI